MSKLVLKPLMEDSETTDSVARAISEMKNIIEDGMNFFVLDAPYGKTGASVNFILERGAVTISFDAVNLDTHSPDRIPVDEYLSLSNEEIERRVNEVWYYGVQRLDDSYRSADMEESSKPKGFILKEEDDYSPEIERLFNVYDELYSDLEQYAGLSQRLGSHGKGGARDSGGSAVGTATISSSEFQKLKDRVRDFQHILKNNPDVQKAMTDTNRHGGKFAGWLSQIDKSR